jgi:hypothetical protein
MDRSEYDVSSLIQQLISETGRQKARDLEHVGLQLAEASAGAFACGLVRGRWGGVEIGGVPLDLGAGVLLHLLGLSGLAGSRSRDLHNLAEGALSTYFATWGATLGKKMRNGEQVLPIPSVFGRVPEQPPADKATVSNGSPRAADVQLMELIRNTLSS